MTRYIEMKLTENEVRTVCAVFGELLKMKYGHLNTFLGSVTIKEMSKLYSKIRYADYCERNKIKYEDMTEDDYINAYYESCEF